MQGYIKLYRKIVDWEWYTDMPTCKLWFHLLILANHEDNKWRGQIIKRGSCVTSYQSLSIQTGLTIQQIRTSLRKLESTNDITKISSKKNTVIIVTNYESYQCQQFDNTQDSIQTTDNQQSINIQDNTQDSSQVTTNKNDKNNKNILVQSDNIATEPVFIELILNDKSLYPIYENNIDEWEELYPSVDIRQELRNMKGWLISNPAKRKTKKGILRFINTWLAKQQDSGKRNNNSKKEEIKITW